jgi:alginate O-acetyltransferase complex protein AlgI
MSLALPQPRPAVRWYSRPWLPPTLLTVAAGWLSVSIDAWQQMWLLAVAIYASFKWLTFSAARAARGSSLAGAVSYLLLWVGMDAESFFDRRRQAPPARWTEWAWSLGQMTFGLWLLLFAAPPLRHDWPLLAAWLAMLGVVSVLHFGLAHLLSLVWRAAGISATPIMYKPLLATSLADFWGRRWNLAFRDLAHQFVFRPLIGRVGPAGALMGVFFASGLVHDAVISLTAGGGYGLPTLYFLLQGVAVLFQRSRVGRCLGIGGGVRGWVFAVVMIVGPVGLLFHRPFVHQVVLPTLDAIAGAVQ